MSYGIPSYLSLRYESEEEQKYLSGLIEQFEMAKNTSSFHLALFAYHLLFMSFVYQTIAKIKKWMPDRFSDALIQSPAEVRKKHQELASIWSLSEFRERSVFELLNLLQICEEEVKKCKSIIDYRNNSFGHATGLLVSEEELENKIQEYDQTALKIHELSHQQLNKIFEEYFKSIEPGIKQTKDEIELNLVLPHRLSDKDLESLAAECLIKPDSKKKNISKILQADFGIYIDIIK